MPIKQGIGIYYGPDNEYHFDQKIDVVSRNVFKEITGSLNSLNLLDSRPQLDIPTNILIECVNRITKLCHEVDEWPEDDWVTITDKDTGQEYDVNFYLDDYVDDCNTGKVVVYKIDKKSRQTETDVWRTVYVTSLR